MQAQIASLARLDPNAARAKELEVAHSTWSPPPGRMNPNLLRDILEGIRGRRLFLSWGSGRHSPPAAGAGPQSCGAA